MNVIYCPYCLMPADVREVLYRCLKDQPECATPFLGDRQAICPNCKTPAFRRVCPNPDCRHDFPAGYCSSSYRNLIIPIFGALNSGKSTYLAVLIHEMSSRVARELDATFAHRDDQTQSQYANFMARPLFKEGLVLPATTAGEGLTPTSPLVYRLRYNSKKAKSVNLVFFDAAGEDMAEEHLRDRYGPYLNAADGVIFIVDPAELPGSGGDLARSGIMPATGGVSAGEHTVVQLTQLLRDLRPSPRRKVRIPACLVLSKIDALPTRLSRHTAIDSLPRHTGGLDGRDRAVVHDEVYALLDRWRSSLGKEMEAEYERFGLFAISALGAPPHGDRVDPTGVRPHRATDPLIWLLAEYDAAVRC
jgi:hypothetical protein